MVRKDTNKQYSLRKLKTGTASVAVAVAVLGAGFANQTTVKAEEAQNNNSGKLTLERKYNALTNENESLRREKDKYLYEKEELEKKNKELDSQVAGLIGVVESDEEEAKRSKNMYETFLKQSKDQVNELTAEKDKLAEKAKKLEEDKQISDASRKSLSRDLEASREAKKKVEADLAALTA
ncbi:TPA: YSIRK-type signal peptide-containing protein, partial [Streptococcus pyogenes]|nr:YSIRK-type signal peptide-containing protein [Streptococcus pyogenes]